MAQRIAQCEAHGSASALLDLLKQRTSSVTALDGSRAGRGGLVFVAGDAGIGKSRLAHEAMSMAR